MVGGDNATECEVSQGRNNLLGRGSPKSSHVHVLASRRVLAKPGLAAVLEALKTARGARILLGCSSARSPQIAETPRVRTIWPQNSPGGDPLHRSISLAKFPKNAAPASKFSTSASCHNLWTRVYTLMDRLVILFFLSLSLSLFSFIHALLSLCLSFLISVLLSSWVFPFLFLSCCIPFFSALFLGLFDSFLRSLFFCVYLS